MTRRFQDDDALVAGRTEETREAFDLPEAPETLKQALLTRTTRRMRMERGMHYAGLAALIGAAYVLGIFSYPLYGETKVAPTQPVEVAAGDAQDKSLGSAGDDERVFVTQELLNDPERLTLLINQLPLDDKMRVLREAGDLYLVMDDIPSATGCYQRLLALMPTLDGSDTEEDSWLLLALKSARIQENNDDDQQV